MKKMILASHGRMAAGLKDSMEMVVGNVDDLICFGLMPGEDPGGLTEKVEKLVKEEPGAQFLVLVDIRGGSVSNSLSRLSVYDNVRIINGMNMALAIGLYLTDGILTDQEIEDYLDTNEWQGKAGAYAIQGVASKFVEKIDGDLENVIGMPMYKVIKYLEA